MENILEIPKHGDETSSPLVGELFQAGAHIAYSRSRRHPSVEKYLFGKKNNLDIFDLTKTEHLLVQAETYMRSLGALGKTVLFVGTKPEAREAVATAGETLTMPAISRRWIGGLLTNFEGIKKRIEVLKRLRDEKESGGFEKYAKKEAGVMSKKLADLIKNFGGVETLTKLPDALFVVDSRKESIAVAEAEKTGVPVIGILGSDCDMTKVTYPILANDASAKSISYIVGRLTKAYSEGKEKG